MFWISEIITVFDGSDCVQETISKLPVAVAGWGNVVSGSCFFYYKYVTPALIMTLLTIEESVKNVVSQLLVRYIVQHTRNNL